MKRAGALICLIAVVAVAPSAHARPRWKERIDKKIGGASVGVAVRVDGYLIYRHQPKSRRVPASAQKLLASIALFDALGADFRFRTRAMADDQPNENGVLRTDIWLVGRGDPTVSAGGAFGRSLPFKPTRLGALARLVADAGVAKIEGDVIGSNDYFARDWFAPGWQSDFPDRYVAFPTALVVDGNKHDGRHIDEPEKRAARMFKNRLKARGIAVTGAARIGDPPAGLATLAELRSRPLDRIASFLTRYSSNFVAEVLGKRLGVAALGPPGSIASGAEAIEARMGDIGVASVAHDSSGLSYSNRISPLGLTRALEDARSRPWWADFRSGLAKGGQGTLENRFADVRLRAKTGTLTQISTLAGWVWLERVGGWAEFAILSKGESKSEAVRIEDGVVTILSRRGR